MPESGHRSPEQDNQPISRLDDRVDELLRALGRLPDLEGLIAGMRMHEELAAHVSPDFPGAVDMLAGAELRQSLINVADEVLTLRRTEADHGNSN
jgi:hypothetical protein